MGQTRILMKLIQKEKARKTTFQKRKRGLMKKAYELSTLCGVDVCVIIYAPNFDGEGIAEPETWPKHKGELHRIIEKYYNTTIDRFPKIYDVQEYYKERIKKVEGEISKVSKEIIKHMYPTWDNSFNTLRSDELRMFCSMLDARVDACNQKKNILKEDIKGKAIIAESENPYLVSYQNSNFFNLMQPHQNSFAFMHEFQLGQSSEPSMIHYGQNGMTSWGGDHHKFAIDGVESNQNWYYNGNTQSYPLYNKFGNLELLPPTGFQVNGFYDIDIFQPHMFNYMHQRK